MMDFMGIFLLTGFFIERMSHPVREPSGFSPRGNEVGIAKIEKALLGSAGGADNFFLVNPGF